MIFYLQSLISFYYVTIENGGLCKALVWEYEGDSLPLYEYDASLAYWGQEYDLNQNLGFAFP